MTTLHLTVSGVPLEASHVDLFPATKVAEWRAMVGKAQTLLGGISSPVGFLGSAEWVIGASVVTGLLTGGASNAMAKDGTKLLIKAQAVLQEIRASGRAFEVRAIRGVELPYPAAWSATGPGVRMVEYETVPMLHRGGVLREHGKTKADVLPSGKLAIEDMIDWTMIEAEFVPLITPTGPVIVRWSAVDTYSGLR